MNFNSKLTPILAGAVVAVVLVVGGYFLYQARQKQTNLQDPQVQQKLVQEEVKKLVAEISKLIDLPVEENPTVATVTDVDKLKDQPFFARAKNGMKVLIYTQAKKAILYDPLAKKIIDVAPVNIGTFSASVQQLKVALRNGTKTVGLTAKIETELKKSIPELNVVSKENAEKQDYDKTIVVAINDSARDLAQSIAKALNATVDNLPTDEIKPKDIDIVVILGKDSI